MTPEEIVKNFREKAKNTPGQHTDLDLAAYAYNEGLVRGELRGLEEALYKDVTILNEAIAEGRKQGLEEAIGLIAEQEALTTIADFKTAQEDILDEVHSKLLGLHPDLTKELKTYKQTKESKENL